MADYYFVISRAVAALEVKTFAERRAIYDRARAAQLKQLGAGRYNRTEFERERSMLEDAIARVEAKTTNNRVIAYAPSNARGRPADTTPLRPIQPISISAQRRASSSLARLTLLLRGAKVSFPCGGHP